MTAPIEGSIGFGGEFNAYTQDDESGSTTTDMTQASSIQSIDENTAVIATSGDFTGIPDFTVVDSWADFDIPADSSEIPFQAFWSVSSGGTTFTMNIESFDVSNLETDSFDFEAVGQLTSTDPSLDTTPGIIDATFNTTGVEATFSATSTSIPSPSTLALLGIGLIGLGAAARVRA
ncbi:PEP-CTERM sorting domain-containing protein [Rhodovibrio sodomensis]|uniref:PEP-CTERM sorting domain-containing protein n=1 Tax=Rhodovibrio sodomensis TaxID=1088 RepID=UPI0019049789|nr:PEP-CTERM sorting domain-containing protein [Rhodovibrio sodomensis]